VAGLTIHYQTLGLAVGVVAVFSAIIMIMMWAVNQKEKGPGVWALAAALGAVTFFSLWTEPFIGTYAIAVNGVFSVISVALILEGILRFRGGGDPIKRRRAFVPLVAVLAVASFVSRDAIAPRFLFLDTAHLIFACVSAYVLVRGARGFERVVNGGTSLFFLMIAGVLAWRWCLAASGALGEDYRSHPIMAIVFFAALVYMLGWTCGMVIAVNLRVRQQLDRLIREDSLTGLSNRTVLHESFEHEVSRHARFGTGFGLAVIDVNGFKPLNDTYGHVFGDHVLQAFAGRLRQGLRDTDQGFRTGGDEFLVLFSDASSARDVSVAVDRLGDILNGIVETDQKRVRMAVSIGGAFYPDDGTTLDSLAHAADMAMYAKKSGAPNKSTVLA